MQPAALWLPGTSPPVQHTQYAAYFLQAIAQPATAEPQVPAAFSVSTDDAIGNPELLASSRAELLETLTGPVVKITVRYHTDFGDCMKVIGSSSELGGWDAAAAPLMVWGEGDLWSLVLPCAAGEHEFKASGSSCVRVPSACLNQCLSQHFPSTPFLRRVVEKNSRVEPHAHYQTATVSLAWLLLFTLGQCSVG